MREMNESEVIQISGAGFIGDAWDDIRRITKEFGGWLEELQDAGADALCVSTGNCELN